MPQVCYAEVCKVRGIIKISVPARCFTKHCNTVESGFKSIMLSHGSDGLSATQGTENLYETHFFLPFFRALIKLIRPNLNLVINCC